MPTETPVPNDHPLMVAWNAYKQTEDYANTLRWAVYPKHTEGSLWVAFARGWRLRSMPTETLTLEEWTTKLYKLAQKLKHGEEGWDYFYMSIRAVLEAAVTQERKALREIVKVLARQADERARAAGGSYIFTSELRVALDAREKESR